MIFNVSQLTPYFIQSSKKIINKQNYSFEMGTDHEESDVIVSSSSFSSGLQSESK